MNNRFESENKLLIISPTQQDFSELRVMFDEKDAKVLYLAQVKELSNENTSDTFVFYHKGNKSFVFHEFEDPSQCSFSRNVEETSILDYWKTLAAVDKMDKENFFKYSEIDFSYKELDGLLETNLTANKSKTRQKNKV